MDQGEISVENREQILYPRVAVRPPPPPEVPEPFAQDYLEACLVIPDSPKASAAISRRCLQAVLRDAAGVKPADLSREIDEAMPHLPPYLADAIDAVRNVGNFAAHPVKSRSTGEVVDVEEGEAEWLLDVLEGLFAFYFVEPAALKEKRDLLNAKLQDPYGNVCITEMITLPSLSCPGKSSTPSAPRTGSWRLAKGTSSGSWPP